MTHMDCAAFGDAATELALGILTGADRSAALEHIDRCPCCQAEAASLAGAADRLLDLIPARSAPAGLESRLAEAFRQTGPGQAARSCRTETAPKKLAVWRWRAGAAAAAVATAGLVCIGLHEIARPPAIAGDRGAAVAILRTPAGAHAGEVVVTWARRPWLLVIVNAGAPTGRYYCYLRVAGGRQEFEGAYRVDPDGSAWLIRLPVTDRHLIGAQLVGPGGTEIASATFS